MTDNNQNNIEEEIPIDEVDQLKIELHNEKQRNLQLQQKLLEEEKGKMTNDIISKYTQNGEYYLIENLDTSKGSVRRIHKSKVETRSASNKYKEDYEDRTTDSIPTEEHTPQ